MPLGAATAASPLLRIAIKQTDVTKQFDHVGLLLNGPPKMHLGGPFFTHPNLQDEHREMPPRNAQIELEASPRAIHRRSCALTSCWESA
jgi:hypothetical protein